MFVLLKMLYELIFSLVPISDNSTNLYIYCAYCLILDQLHCFRLTRVLI